MATSINPPPSPRPPSPAAPARFVGLAWRVFGGIAVVVFVVLGVTLAVASTVAKRNADDAIQVGLAQTNAGIANTLQQQRMTMLKTARLFADQPSFRSAVDAARAARDSASVLDQATVAAQSLGATWTQIADARGVLLARSDKPAARGDTLRGPLIGGALDGHDTQGFAVNAGTDLAQAVAVPIAGAGGSMMGVLMALQEITDSLAKQIGAQSGSDLIFYVVRPNGPPEISISPAKLGPRPDLRASIQGALLAPVAARQDTGGTAPMMMAMGGRQELEIAGTRYVGQRTAVLSAGGNEVGGFIALRDKDQALAGYYKLRNALLGAGVAGLLLAFALSVAISRRIVRPVRVLVDATRRAADGDYEADIPAPSGDEIGALANAFRHLLADLRGKQALVDFLQTPSGGGTVLPHQLAPTLQLGAMSGRASLEPGDLLANRFEIKTVLGVGGMGIVYKAVDRELGDVLAIKTLKPDLIQDDPSALARFKDEIRLARRISHRNVVRTHDLGESGGMYFITMEFVDGASLKDLIVSRGRLPATVVLPIAKQLCRALEVAHDEGVIHRDIKPQNMVVEAGGVLKVMDFGIARLAQRAPGSGQTQSGMVVGTPEYMAPEQLLGDEVDARADLYAAGVVLYECLTGRPPYQANTPIALISKVLEDQPRPPREIAPEIPVALADIVLHTLAKDPADRPRSASELHRLLERVQ